ncbi:MAG: hypothetical protein H6977_10260 [Gammaproteobacteria bacterium]|nr:hypothetical protein [Gammaproteobacteria bacterium]
MENIGWLLLGIFYVGPYVIAAAILVGYFVYVVRIGFGQSRKVGAFAIIAIAMVLSIPAYSLFIRYQNALNTACGTGVGIHAYEYPSPDAYVLTNVWNTAGGNWHRSDATIKEAILNVAHERVPYVEIMDSTENMVPYGVIGAFSRVRGIPFGSGYYKIYLDSSGAQQCRWRTPEDFDPSLYRLYLSYEKNHETNQSLREKMPGKRCVAIDYVAKSNARYLVEILLNTELEPRVFKHEIRVSDTENKNRLIGDSIAYEYRPDGVIASLAFGFASKRKLPSCPQDMLAGEPLHTILNMYVKRS